VTGDHPLIRLEGLSKTFGPIYANREITLDIHAGKIKSLLGENGAGKSTLMGMLAGRLHPDGGRILIDGRPRLFARPGMPSMKASAWCISTSCWWRP
jgi:ABC-type uncharacterized transport system ATPase subunit